MSDLYAKLFVSTVRTRDELLTLVADVLDGDPHDSTVVASTCEADVRGNDDYSPQAVRANASDFVFFPYTVELFSRGEGLGVESFLQTVGLLMNRLYSVGMQVAVACDWEEQLPGKGKLGL